MAAITGITVRRRSGSNKKIASAPRQIMSDIEAAVDRLGKDILKNLRPATPYKDGGARRGWKFKNAKYGWKIRNRVEYIGALNEGSSSQSNPRRNWVQSTIKGTDLKL